MSESSFMCPHCGHPLDKIFKVEGRNQYICPYCKKTINAKLVPEGIPIEVLPKKSKSRRKGKAISEFEFEETMPETEGEATSVYERIRSPSEILVMVLKKYGIKDGCIRLLKSKSEMREGGLHPLELEQRLNEFSKAFTGIEDKRLIPDVVEDYMFMLQKESEKAKERGIRYVIPMNMRRVQTTGPRYVYGSSTYPTGDKYGYPARTPGYSSTRYGGYGVPQEPQTPADIETRIMERTQKMIMEFEKQREEKTKMDKLMDMIAEQQKTIMQLQTELKNLRENPPVTTPTDIVTKDEFEKALAQRDKDAYQKYLEMQLQDTKNQINRLLDSREKADEKWEQRLKEFQDRYEKIIAKTEADHKEERKELMKRIEDARREASVQGYKTDEARFRADVMKTMKDITSDVMEKAPVRKTLQVTVAPVQEKPPERKESKKSSEHEEVELPEELIVESEEEE